MFYLADTSQKIDNMIKQYVLRTPALPRSVFVRISAIPSSDSRERYIFRSLESKQPGNEVDRWFTVQAASIPGQLKINLVSKQLYYQIDGILLLSSEFAQRRN